MTLRMETPLKAWRRISAFLLIGFLLCSVSSTPSTARVAGPAGGGSFIPPPERCLDEAGTRRLVEAGVHGPGAAFRPQGVGQVEFPSYSWPMERALRDGCVLVNYVDDDPSGAIHDYSNGAWAYDGHNGTDFSLYNFRSMDRGYRILAAAPGTVSSVVYNKPDRHTGPPYADTENSVVVSNADGTSTWYLHMRTNAVTVNPGEAISTGTVIGLVGSSGTSTDAHLHFEVGQYTPSWVRRDPWNGPNNLAPSLWASQLPYQGAQHLWVADLGVFTQTSAGGNLGSLPPNLFKERPSVPAVMGATEPWIPVFLQLQGLAGDAYHLDILRPNSTVYASIDYTLPGNLQYGWHYWYWGWNGGVSAADYGTWAVRVMINSVEVKRTNFQVGATTVFGPRLEPKAGRSFRIDGTVQRDTMHVSPLGGPVTYSLIHKPAWVTLTDSIVTVPATSAQTTRSLYFQALAVDGAGRSDTMWYHIVDPSKPQGEQTAVEEPIAFAGALQLSPPSPNPVQGSTSLRFASRAGAAIHLAIFDPSGRQVRTLLDGVPSGGGASGVARWDGKGERGRKLPAGVYFARLQSGTEQATRRVVLLN